MKQNRVCVIGCGVISPNHLQALSAMEDVILAGACDVIEERAAKAALAYGCPAYTDHVRMIEEVRPDAVHLCLPHHLHSTVAVDCMKRGIAVLSEKPMDAHLAGAEVMWQTHLETSVPLGVIFQNHYNPGCLFLKKALGEGRLGRIRSICATVMWHRDQAYYAQGSWRQAYSTAGGGVIINQAIHTLDLLRRLAGGEVLSVKATVSHHGDTAAEVEDTAEGRICFDNGVEGLFYFTLNNGFDDAVRLTLHCDGGDAVMEGDGCCIRYSDGSTETETGARGVFVGAKAVYGSGHGAQIADFYRAPREAVERDTYEALKTQRLIHSILAAAGIPCK